MEMVKLRNGSEVPESAVTSTMLHLEELWNSGFNGICTVSDLVKICRRDPTYRKFGNNEEELKKLALLQEDGRPHDVTRNIVLSAIEGDGLSMEMVSPLAED